jgi:hypothetical protein
MCLATQYEPELNAFEFFGFNSQAEFQSTVIINEPFCSSYPLCCSLFLDLLLQSGRINSHGAVAELADAADLKSAGGNTVWVQVPPALPASRAPGARFSLRMSNKNYK